MHEFFPRSTFFNFEFTRVVGTIAFGGADLAECLDAATQIASDDPESWHRGWLIQAEKAHALALEAVEHGDSIAARDAFLRAANYFRASQYMFNDCPWSPDPRVSEISSRSVNAFRQAIPMLGHRTHILEIPYQDAHLPGYLFLPRQGEETGRKIPVIVCINGADSTSEELYLLFGASGCDRGYAVLLFDGPGQGASLRQGRSAMRPDWEEVTSRVLDHARQLAEEHPEWSLDLSRIALAGLSMGAYYTLRGAVDPRISACVAVDPFYDMFDLATSRMPPWFIRAWLAGWVTDGMFDATWRMLSRWNFQLKWELTHVMWIFGKSSPAAAMREMQRYSLKGDGESGEYLRQVKCGVMVSGAAQTIYTAPEISTLRIEQALDHLPEEKRHLWIARDASDGGLQGKVGAWCLLQQRLFQFLDEQLDVKRRIEGIHS
ncbi:alpha/beta hydrolase [Aspergillus campestris IBT 28561]|uniref:Alpha/beta hydrolase n=1 Tax=Aspergillus campestris (strain IBT 28561) TaxID=1392248 RepID=A0A2I1CT53_ASPC2|nr:alpha/beta hydrolase [Aspergillus campestris IBT 28561]PKY00810.1 alpha/beta hydrolase [Aspergillus campestris IBT 28561]